MTDRDADVADQPLAAQAPQFRNRFGDHLLQYLRGTLAMRHHTAIVHIGDVDLRHAQAYQAVLDTPANAAGRIVKMLGVGQHIDINAKISRCIGIWGQQTSHLGRHYNRVPLYAGQEAAEALLAAAVSIMRGGVECYTAGCMDLAQEFLRVGVADRRIHIADRRAAQSKI